MESDCWYCAFCSIAKKLFDTIANRTRTGVDGELLITCGCGSQVMTESDGPEVVRKCVGCDGLQTAPFRRFNDDEIVFEHKLSDFKLRKSAAGETSNNQHHKAPPAAGTKRLSEKQLYGIKQLAQGGRMYDRYTFNRLLEEMCEFDKAERKAILDLMDSKEAAGEKNYDTQVVIMEALAQMDKTST